MTEIVNDPYHYRVIKEVAKSKYYRIFLCEQEETGRECLLQIATTVAHNGKLQRAAYILRELERHADKLEEEYSKIKTDEKVLLNYKLGFPELVDSFICPKEDGRQINVLAFREVENVEDMVPLINITAKDNLRIDLRTSAWIMGKILKLLDFGYNQGISIGLMTSGNILINAERHYVVFFDWTEASWSDALQIDPMKVQSREISQATRAVIIALGGNVETGFFPDNDNDDTNAYIDYLLQMARGNVSDAGKAHKAFYEIVDETWKREFYPFTAKPLELNTKDMEE